MRFFLILPNDRDAGLLRAPSTFTTTFCTTESASDRSTMRIEGQLQYAGPAGLQELALVGPQGISGFVVLVQDKDFHHVRLPYGY